MAATVSTSPAAPDEPAIDRTVLAALCAFAARRRRACTGRVLLHAFAGPSLADGVDDRAGHAGRARLRFVRRPIVVALQQRGGRHHGCFADPRVERRRVPQVPSQAARATRQLGTVQEHPEGEREPTLYWRPSPRMPVARLRECPRSVSVRGRVSRTQPIRPSAGRALPGLVTGITRLSKLVHQPFRLVAVTDEARPRPDDADGHHLGQPARSSKPLVVRCRRT